jgi:hypothetical protein
VGVSVIGIDHAFSPHGIDEHGKACLKKDCHPLLTLTLPDWYGSLLLRAHFLWFNTSSSDQPRCMTDRCEENRQQKTRTGRVFAVT